MSTKESVIKSVPAIKILPPQLAKLKKEEEEETWISGEELYTEGSSDEESCRCKSISSSDKASAESSLSVAKVHRSKNRADKKKKPSSLLSSATHDQDSVSAQSSSKGRGSPISSVSDDDEYPDEEISWKANRETALLKNEIVALEKHRQEYPKICDQIDRIFENYFKNLNNLEKVESENFLRKNEKLQEEIKSSLSFVDTIINELDGRIESIKKHTKRIQIHNRSRLKEIIEHGPPESQKLAQNSKKFFALCPNVQVKNQECKKMMCVKY